MNTEIQALREEMLNQLGAQRESMFKLAVYPFGEGVPGLLTARELEVLGWLAEGKSYEQVLEFVRFEAEDADELKDMAREGIARLIDRSKDKETSGSEWIHWEVEGTAARRHDELIARFDQLVESIRSLVQAGDPERSRRELEDTAARRHEELASKLEQLAEAIRGQTLRLGRD